MWFCKDGLTERTRGGWGNQGILQGAQQKRRAGTAGANRRWEGGLDLIMVFSWSLLTTRNGICAVQQEAYMSNVEHEWLWHK